MRCTALILFLSAFFPLLLHGQHAYLPEHERVVARQQWFLQQRLYPHDSIPVEALQTTFRTEMARRKKQVIASEIQAYSWEQMGPFTTAGRMTSIAVHPTNPNVWIAGSGAAGVWQTTNRGATWEQLPTEDFPTYAVGAVAFNPHDPQEILAGTGEPNFASFTYPGAGMMRSRNGGTTWQPWGTNTLGGAIADIVFHPDDDQLVFAACAGFGYTAGVYRSANRGASWQRVLEGTSAMDIAIHPQLHHIVYAVLSYPLGNSNNGVYRSLDTGRTWTRLTTGLPAQHGRMALAVTPAAPNNLYVLVSQTNGRLDGLYVSTDTGNNFTAAPNMPSDLLGNQGWYNIAVAVSPQTTNDMLLGGVGLYRTTNNGANWISLGVHVDQHAVHYLTSDSAIVGNDGGMYALRGVAAYPKNANLVTTQYYDIGILDTFKLFGGTQDNGSHMRSTAGTWSATELGGDVMRALVHPAVGGLLFAMAPYGLVFKSTTDGQAWFSSTNGINYAEATAWKAPFLISPVSGQSNTLFMGTTRVYRTTDYGASWQAISTDLSSVFDPITALAQATDDAAVVVAAAQNGKVFHTRTGGANWEEISAGLPMRVPTSAAVLPTDKRTFFVAYSGYGVQHVWKTINRGTTWFSVSGDLPDVPVNCFVFDPAEPATKWYIGTDFGVYYTVNGGQNWLPLTTGLGIAPVTDIEISANTGDIYIATFGMGIYRAKLNFLPVELADFRAYPQGSDVVVEWETASELNNSHFIVERSAESAEFDGIARVNGRGTSTTLHRYAFRDTTVPSTADYLAYRLAQVDADGTLSRSRIVEVSRASSVFAPALPAIAPNPFTTETTVSYRLRKTSPVTMVLYSTLGQPVRRFFTNAHHNSGNFTLLWDGKNDEGREVPAGVYLLQLTVRNTTTTSAVLKQ